MFFHSSVRSTEFFRVKYSHVNLKEQYFFTLVYKRAEGPTWVKRVIKDIALPFWTELMEECEALKATTGNEESDPYIFSRDLRPGVSKIDEETISRRWKRWVKAEPNGYNNGLGIKKGFYKIKSLANTEQMDILSEIMGIKAAEKLVANHNAHTTPVMLQRVYDKKYHFRKEAEIKSIMNSFARV